MFFLAILVAPFLKIFFDFERDIFRLLAIFSSWCLVGWCQSEQLHQVGNCSEGGQAALIPPGEPPQAVLIGARSLCLLEGQGPPQQEAGAPFSEAQLHLQGPGQIPGIAQGR